MLGGTAILSAMNGITPHMAGAIDIMVVEQPDGTLKCSPFYGAPWAAALTPAGCVDWGVAAEKGDRAHVCAHAGPCATRLTCAAHLWVCAVGMCTQ